MYKARTGSGLDSYMSHSQSREWSDHENVSILHQQRANRTCGQTARFILYSYTHIKPGYGFALMMLVCLCVFITCIMSVCSVTRLIFSSWFESCLGNSSTLEQCLSLQNTFPTKGVCESTWVKPDVFRVSHTFSMLKILEYIHNIRSLH